MYIYIYNVKLTILVISDCMRKSARGEVTIWGNGSGKLIINGRDITYFEEIIHREQVSYSLLSCVKIGALHLICNRTEGQTSMT